MVPAVPAIKVQDMRGPYVVFDGEFIEKVPARSASNRRHVSEFKGVKTEHKPAKKKLLGGQTEEHWEAIIQCGAFFSLWVTAEEKPKLDELTAALEAAGAGAG
jgi:hypothetical protein